MEIAQIILQKKQQNQTICVAFIVMIVAGDNSNSSSNENSVFLHIKHWCTRGPIKIIDWALVGWTPASIEEGKKNYYQNIPMIIILLLSTLMRVIALPSNPLKKIQNPDCKKKQELKNASRASCIFLGELVTKQN